MTEELESQLSAMFDDELPHSECQLLARRLARDEPLRQRWGRYAAMRACFREEGSSGSVRIASRVRAQLVVETDFAVQAVATARVSGGRNWWRPVAGAAVACSVAALSIFIVRQQSTSLAAPIAQASVATSPSTPVMVPVVSVAAVDKGTLDKNAASSEPDSYVVPAATDTPAFAPTAELANYVVAHSEYSTPLNRRSLLSSFVSSESAQPPPAQPQSSEPESADSASDRQNASR